MSLLRAYDDVGVDVSDIYDPDNILDSAKKQAQDEYLDGTTLEQLADDVEGKFYFIRDLYVDNNDNDSVAIGDNVQKIVDELAQHPARGWAMYDMYEDAINYISPLLYNVSWFKCNDIIELEFEDGDDEY